MTTTQKNLTHENPLVSQPIPALIRKIGIPVSIGIFFNTMFNVVDTFYGGMISEETMWQQSAKAVRR